MLREESLHLDAFEYNVGRSDLLPSNASKDDITRRASQLADDVDMSEHHEAIVRGAHLAYDPGVFYQEDASEEERRVGTKLKALELNDANICPAFKALRREVQHRFQQPFAVWWVTIVSALAAAVQGMDETVISGAQLFYLKYFGLHDNPTITGFVNASPYLTCATMGCWLAIPSNYYLGRRGTIFLWSVVSFAASTWQAFALTWQSFLASRLLLGLSIGANSATVAVYTAECAPAAIRGGLVMFWQLFVAFGIMLGYIMGAAFVNVQYPLNWRLMVGSQLVAPIFVIATVYFGPESPRYLVSRGRHAAAYRSLLRLRHSTIEAARDLYCIVDAMRIEENLRSGRNFFSDIRDIAQTPRVRYAAVASWFIMFMQNFCGINAMTYYTGQVFVETGTSPQTAIYASIGAGALLFLCALPAVKYIDIWGRRPLLILSLLSMCICTLWTGFSYLAVNDTARLAMVAVGIYLYNVAYAPGQGVVPFVYASESFPLYMRTLGMSFSTATTWLLSFSLTLAWPSQLVAMTPTGAFCWYSAWCLIGAVLAYFFVPETRGLNLEELDFVFAMPIKAHGSNKLHLLLYWLRVRSDAPEDVRQVARELFLKSNASTLQEDLKADSSRVEHAVDAGIDRKA